MVNVLVVYYSRKGENYMPGGVQVLEKGNTAYAAEFIRDALNADLFEIQPVKAYLPDIRIAAKKPPPRPGPIPGRNWRNTRQI